MNPSRVFHFFLQCRLILSQCYRAAIGYYKRAEFYQRRTVVKRLGTAPATPASKARVIAVIVHVTPPLTSMSSVERDLRIDRLRSTIDGLMSSLASCDLSIVVQSMKGRHVVPVLPDYQRDSVRVHEANINDPMYLGFEAQNRFVENADRCEWFMYLEDDIVIQDGYFIERLAHFHGTCGDRMAVLLPNRYEFWQGKKRYIDLIADGDLAWNRLTELKLDGARFAECTNPHSGLYCLAKDQLKAWIRLPRYLNRRSLTGGVRESAATFCLEECFCLYKPHPSNLGYLEVRHHDNKYSLEYAQIDSPYYLKGV